MRLRHVTLLIATVLLAGCHIGPSAATYRPAAHAEGITMSITTDTRADRAELLEVRENGIVVLLADGKVALVPWSVTRNANALEVPSLRSWYGSGMPPSAEARRNLLLLSHFPQGMSAEIQQRYLAAHGQTSIEAIH